MDRLLDKPLSDLIKDSKASSKAKAVKGKAAASKKKPVKASGSKKAVKVGKARPAVQKKKIVMPTANHIMDRIGVSSKPRVPKPTGSAVVFSNLAYNITMEEMKELCSTIGPCGKVIMDVKGKADVMFFNRLDAVTAVKKFNGLTLDGRPMVVALKESAVSKRGGDMASSKALLFGGGGGGLSSRGGRGQTTFSVSLGSNKLPKKGKKTTVLSKKEAEKKEKKPKAKKPEEPKPKVDGATLDMDMDAYFANRPAKAAAEGA